MTPSLKILVILFGISVVVFLLLLFYKANLERKGDEAFQQTPERLSEKHKAALRKVDALSKPMWIVGTLMVLLMLASVGLWIVQGLGL